MLTNIDRHIEFLHKTQRRFYVHKDTIWVEYNHMIQPYGAVSESYNLMPRDRKVLLAKLNGHLVRWTDGFGENKNPNWYAVICSDFRSVDALKSKAKTKINRAIKNCEVRRIGADVLAEDGYPVLIAAFSRYRSAYTPTLSALQYKQRISQALDFADIIHHWGVYYDNKLVGYSINYVFGPTEVNYSTTKFHPDYLKYRSSDSLFYQMNKYYLQERKCQYVNDGFRAMLHQTSVQDYLKNTFGFREEHTNLYVNYRPLVSTIMTLSYPFRSVIGRRHAKLKALYQLEEIRRASSRLRAES
jgi:hypothetical protein